MRCYKTLLSNSTLLSVKWLLIGLRRLFQTFSSTCISGHSHFQEVVTYKEVPNIVISLGNLVFWKTESLWRGGGLQELVATRGSTVQSNDQKLLVVM